jgi:hypothetical protein
MALKPANTQPSRAVSCEAPTAPGSTELNPAAAPDLLGESVQELAGEDAGVDQAQKILKVAGVIAW